MPAFYDFRCTACGKVEQRYRNARRSRCCHADLVRVDPLAETDQPKTWTETIDGVEWRVQKVTGELAQILAGRQSYLRYTRITPLPQPAAGARDDLPDCADRPGLVVFLHGKVVAGLRFDEQPGGVFDILFADGSELELHIIGEDLVWRTKSAEEIAAEERGE